MKFLRNLFTFSFVLSVSFSAVVFAESVSPKFVVKPIVNEFIGQDGKSYDFGTIEAGEVLQGEGFLRLIDDIRSDFEIELVSATEFDGMSEVAGWLELDSDGKITIENAKNPVTVPFKINVPDNLLPGEYAVLFQAVLNDFEGLELAPGSSRVRIASGFMVRFGIAGERAYELNFQGLDYDRSLLADSGDLNLILNYRNLGNVKVYPSAHYVVKNLAGEVLLDEEISFKPCYSGTSCVGPINKTSLEFGVFDKVETQVELYYSKIDGGERQLVGQGSFVHYLIPWIYILIVVALLVLVLVFFLYRSSKRKYLISLAKQYKVKEGDDLQSVAKAASADPNQIVFLNKIKAPYFLTPGDTIYIPKKNS